MSRTKPELSARGARPSDEAGLVMPTHQIATEFEDSAPPSGSALARARVAVILENLNEIETGARARWCFAPNAGLRDKRNPGAKRTLGASIMRFACQV